MISSNSGEYFIGAIGAFGENSGIGTTSCHSSRS